MTRAPRKKQVAPAAMPAPLVEPQDGTGWGLQIHRHRDPRDWPHALEQVPEQHRAEAEAYLRGIAARMRNLKRMAEAAGYSTVAEWKAAKGGS